MYSSSMSPSPATGVFRSEVGSLGLLNSPLSIASPEARMAIEKRISGQGCMMCTPGRFQAVFGTSACGNCPWGQFQRGHGHARCERCSVGHYSAAKLMSGAPTGLITGATVCSACTAGHYQDTHGSTVCKKCPRGYFMSDSGQEACQACAPGRLASNEGQSTCDACPAGLFQMIAGQSKCLQCSAGYYSPAAARTSCTTCSRGTFMGSLGASTCNQCQTGRYTSAEAFTVCTLCDVGKFTSSFTSRGVGVTVCEVCELGRYMAARGASICTIASPGYYVDLLGQWNELKCPRGKYSASTGARSPSPSASPSCQLCPAGFFCDSEGTFDARAKPCPAGRWGRAGEQRPSCSGVCPAGYRCPAGTKENGWLLCGLGRFCAEGTGASGQSVASGHYCSLPASNDPVLRWSTCQAQARCEQGHFCTGGVREACAAGRFQSGVARTSCSGACSAGFFCPAGSTTDKAEQCAPVASAHPEKFYCPYGTALRHETANYASASLRGQYTASAQPATHRTAALTCVAGTACWHGIRHPLLSFSDDICGSGTLVVPLQVSLEAKSSIVSFIPVSLSSVDRSTGAAGTLVATGGLAYSLLDFAAFPGCTVTNPFTITATGQLAVAPIALSPVACPYLKLTVRASKGSEASADCKVVARLSTGDIITTKSSTTMAVGSAVVCIISESASGTVWGGQVACLGNSADGTGRVKLLSASSALYGFVQLSAGTRHVCALDAAGKLSCWGSKAAPQLGHEHLWNTAGTSERLWHVEAGEDFTCGISRGIESDSAVVGVNVLKCKGQNARLAPQYEQYKGYFAANPVAAVSVTNSAFCVILQATFSIRCFGMGVPALLANTPTSGKYTAISAGWSGNACALRALDGFMECWGVQWGNTRQVYTTRFDSIAVGEDWVCAVKTTGKTLQCYGMYVPKLFVSYTSVPQIPVAQLSVHGQTLCIVSTDGDLHCFGTGTAAQSVLTGVGSSTRKVVQDVA